jgi:NADH-quinone oxidoreductase subunit A
MLAEFLPIAVVLVLGILVAAGLLLVSNLLGQKKPSLQKNTVYECGVPLLEGARKRYPIKFFLIAMMFILFDIEVAFLFPWAVVFRKLGLFGFVEMTVFVAILLVGFIYIWRKGGLEWE